MIFLYGPPASGKTTLGKRLAQAVGWHFVDLDEEIVKTAGRAIRDFFATDGESAFRKLEGETLIRVGETAEANTIVALGGGTLLAPANRAFAEAHGLIWCLEAPSPEERARRIAAGGDVRPLGDKAIERAPHYASFPSRIAATFDLPGSLVIVGRSLGNPDIFANVVVADENAARAVFPSSKVESPKSKVVSRDAEHSTCAKPIVSQKKITESLDEGHSTFDIRHSTLLPSGERFKTLNTVTSIWRFFGDRGIGRRDRVAAFGGGVTGDLTGFAAATWMRGVAWVNYPTTLLSMVDASTGGKTGCDLPEGKNLIGAFHAPVLVVIDADRLATLPPRELRCGRAEMIKHEIISGRMGTGTSADIPSPTEIAENLAVKVGIVREDPFERTGRRLLLNCGHTVGHAVEIATNFAVSHGEAVAIGCVEEARLAVRMGLAAPEWPDELAARFAAVGLPTTLLNGLTFDALIPLMRGDKKRTGNTVTFALPCGNGDVRAVTVDLG